MNKEIFRKILSNYKEKYDFINDAEGCDEIYKWPAVRCCIDNWDIDAEDFLAMLKKSMRLSMNIIENKIKHPINGLTFLCEQGKTEQVREAFRNLLSDEGDVRDRQSRAEAFQDSINDMIEEIAPEKWSFKQDRRDPLMYLAFIKPESNYMFKASPAHEFATYVDFGDDIGSGQTFRLDIYHRLCDEILAEIETDEEMLTMLDEELKGAAKRNEMSEESLLSIPGKLKIMVYDIMFCADAYTLFEGIEKPAKKGSREAKERARRRRIEEIYEQIDSENAELDRVIEDIPPYPDLTGAELISKKYGKGTVHSQDGHYIYINYKGEDRTFTLPDCFVKGFLKGADDDVMAVCQTISDLDARKRSLSSSLNQLRMELSALE